jgi:hypothetical protein
MGLHEVVHVGQQGGGDFGAPAVGGTAEAFGVQPRQCLEEVETALDVDRVLGVGPRAGHRTAPAVACANQRGGGVADEAEAAHPDPQA